jgi:hypothetical protein
MNIGDEVLIVRPGPFSWRKGRISLIERNLYLVTVYLTEQERLANEFHLPTKTFTLTREEIRYPYENGHTQDNSI